MQGQFIQLEGTVNTRDLGGFEGFEGRKVKPGRLIRSEQFSRITPEDAEILSRLTSPAMILDFRSPQEAHFEKDILFEGADYLHLPILRSRGELTDAYERENISFGQRMAMAIQAMDCDVLTSTVSMYDTMMRDPFTVSQYRKFFDILLNHEEGATIWHCSAGKDRTGIGAALVLLALGVDPEAVRADYLASNDFLAERTEGYVEQAGKDGVDVVICEELRKWCGVFPEYYDTAMASVNKNWGSVDDFLRKAMGLTAAKRKQLIAMYLD